MAVQKCACVQVQFEGATGKVAFDSFGRRRNYRLDVLEHRLDNDMFKVTQRPPPPQLNASPILFLTRSKPTDGISNRTR